MFRPFARPVACCCIRLLTTATGTQQQATLLAQQCGLSYVQITQQLPNFLAQQCWELLRPSAPG